jgi:hypothetical protein
MKKSMSGIAVAGLLLAMTMSAFAVSPGVDDHLTLAASYEQRAGQQDAVIAEHQQMKKEGVTDKTSPAVKDKMAKHCDAIIEHAKKLKEDYEAFARFHRMQAEESKDR